MTDRTIKPVRLRLSRKRGFRLQEHSRSLNGLPAIVVARPSIWGNPFRIEPGISAEEAVAKYRAWILRRYPRQLLFASLAGHNLACWCALDHPCHADVLLEIANG